MDISRALTLPRSLGADAQLRLTLLDEPYDQVDRWLITDRRVAVARRLAERMPARLAEAVCAWADVEPREALPGLERTRRRRLTHALTDLPVPVTGSRGWNAAEVTAGGVPMAEVEHRGMASRIVPGLHLAGEMLDVDGRIGGFNFQWAWATGWLAGRAAVDRLASP